MRDIAKHGGPGGDKNNQSPGSNRTSSLMGNGQKKYQPDERELRRKSTGSHGKHITLPRWHINDTISALPTA